jgi:hypothetical protein
MVNTPGGDLEIETLGIGDVLNANSALGFEQAVFGKWGLWETILPNGGHVKRVVQSGYDFFAGKAGCCIDEGYDPHVKDSARFKNESCNVSDPGAYQVPGCVACLLPNPLNPDVCSPPTDVTSYATTENVNDTIAWLDSLPTGQRWFVILSFNSAHSPLHAPPGNSLSDPARLWIDFNPFTYIDENPVRPRQCSDLQVNNRICYRAAIEAIDTEIGRLLGAEDKDETIIIVVGDNGSMGTHVGEIDGDSSRHFVAGQADALPGWNQRASDRPRAWCRAGR